MKRSFVRNTVVVGLLVFAPLARADIKDAEELFRQGKAEMAKGNYERACPMFAESYKQDPGTGTLLNLALCHEAIGRIATAWGEWRAVEQQARAANPPREERVKQAREHADKLEPRLSRIKILVPPDARVEGLSVKVDGEPKGEPLWSGVPVDPGTRKVEASAPGKKPAIVTVKVDDEGVTIPVTVPKLEDAPATAPPSGAASAPGTDLEKVEEYAANRARRTAGFVIGGVGLATRAVGGVFGILAIVRDNEAKETCPAPCFRGSTEADAADDMTQQANVFANVANVTVPLGLVGTVVGTYLVLSAGATEKVTIHPTATRSAGGVSLTARW